MPQMQQLVKVRIRETGQVLDLVPAVAAAMLNGGTAERVVTHPESAMLEQRSERAVSQRKPAAKRK